MGAVHLSWDLPMRSFAKFDQSQSSFSLGLVIVKIGMAKFKTLLINVTYIGLFLFFLRASKYKY